MNTTLSLTGGYLKPIELRVDRNDQHKDTKRLERMDKLRAHLVEATTPAKLEKFNPIPVLFESTWTDQNRILYFKTKEIAQDWVNRMNDSIYFNCSVICECE